MSILTQNTEETSGKSMKNSVQEPIVRAFRTALEESEMSRSSGSGDRKLARTFLLIDLGAAMGYLLGDRGSSSGGAETLAEMASESKSRSGSGSSAMQGSSAKQESGGRGTLSKLFMLGAVVGLGYVLRRRSGSMDKVVNKATERARTVTDEAAMRMGETAGRTETVTDQAAERVQETGETAAEQIQKGSEKAADRVEEGGEQAADQMEGAGETVEEVEGQMEEKAGEMTEDGGESETGNEGEESEE